MAKKVNRRLVVLSTSAIAAVYAVGYARTAPAAARIAAAESPASPTVTAHATPAGSAPLPARPNTAPPAQPAPANPAAPAPAAPAAAGASTVYQDGTYGGYGTSRRGDVEVAVVIQGGRILSADMTRCMTQYPESR